MNIFNVFELFFKQWLIYMPNQPICFEVIFPYLSLNYGKDFFLRKKIFGSHDLSEDVA